MSKTLGWSMLGAVTITSIGIATIFDAGEALGCRRGGARSFSTLPQCVPMVVEPLLPEPPKEVVKEQPPVPAVDKDLRVNVKNLAMLLKQGNRVGATKFARQVVPTIREFFELEALYRPRTNGGLGWGSTPLPTAATDGLERGLMNLPKLAPATAIARKSSNEEAAYWIAAMGELTIAWAPRIKDRDKGKTRASWIEIGTAQRDNALDLAYPAAMGDLNHMKEIAPRITSACNACHFKFK